jgi:hypothetical protein
MGQRNLQERKRVAGFSLISINTHPYRPRSAVQLVAAMPNENTSLFLSAAYSVAVVDF